MNLNIKEKLQNYKRVLSISKKPTYGEFGDTSRVCAIGMAIVGIIGFALYLISVILGV